MKVLSTIILLTLGTVTAREAMEPTRELDQHAWLQQLAGEWTVTSEATDPGGETATWESTESIRAIGQLWIVAEGTAEDDGQTFTSLMTLGYDPSEEAFVGSWIDSIQTRMWTYVGHLDESKKVLTLEAEGPSFADPEKTVRYRDRIELVSSDRKTTTSSVQGEDGTWTPFMKVEARRVK